LFIGYDRLAVNQMLMWLI